VTDFIQSSYRALHLYEQGYVVEGCGLGGSLVFAEQLGLSQQQIIECLDAAVKPWLE
jgi:NaMN:DMB phosphoribosyltransferase